MLPPIGPSALVRGLEELEEQLVWRVIPAKRAVMMQQVSKTVRWAMERVKPPAMIKVKENQGMERVAEGLRQMTRWARITAIDLVACEIEAEGKGRLAEGLGQCSSLAHLNLGINTVGAEGAGRLAAVLGQCPSLAHLDLGFNSIGDEGAGRLAAALGRCPSLAHLDLSWNSIGGEGAGRLDAVAEQCPSLHIIR